MAGPPHAAHRRVGKTRLELPVLGLGTAHLGELFATVPEARARATLEAAWEAGIRYFDTAPWYGRGLAEHRLGGFLRTLPRDAFRITTKVGRTLHRPPDPRRFDRAPWTGGLNFEVAFDYGRDGILRAYEQSLQRLALDRVDALVIHDLDAGYHGDDLAAREAELIDGGGLAALQELKRAGDIQAYGMGVNTAATLAGTVARLDLDFCLVAMPYTLLDHDSLTTGMAGLVRRGVSAIIGAPFASGILVTGAAAAASYNYAEAPPAVLTRVRRMEAVCTAHGVPLPAAALQFVLAHPAVASVIPGASRPSEVRASVAALAASIPDAFWADMKAGGLIHPEAPVPDGP